MIFLPQFVGRRVLGGVAAVRWHHLGGDAVSRRLRRGYFGSCAAVRGHHLGGDAVNLAALPRLDGGYAAVNWVASFLPRIFTELGTDFYIVVFICALFVFICVYCDVVVKRVTISLSKAAPRLLQSPPKIICEICERSNHSLLADEIICERFRGGFCEKNRGPPRGGAVLFIMITV